MKLKKTTCNALAFGMLLSISCSNTKLDANIEYIFAGLSLIAVPTLTYLGITAWANHQFRQATRRNQILEQYVQDGDYEALKNNARDQYFDQLGASSESLSSDYPAIWLQKDATAKKNFLNCYLMSAEKRALSRRLRDALRQLRRNQQFSAERKEYNKERRDMRYKNKKLGLERTKVGLKFAENNRNNRNNRGGRGGRNR